jgi:hypothetical protein
MLGREHKLKPEERAGNEQSRHSLVETPFSSNKPSRNRCAL